MPLYVFECPTCHTTSEVLTRTLDYEVPLCPTCLTPTEKKMSSFHIRGPWKWYKADDYGRAGR